MAWEKTAVATYRHDVLLDVALPGAATAELLCNLIIQLYGPRPGDGYQPLNTGLRLSKKAMTPSLWSSVWRHRLWA